MVVNEYQIDVCDIHSPWRFPPHHLLASWRHPAGDDESWAGPGKEATICCLQWTLVGFKFAEQGKRYE